MCFLFYKGVAKQNEVGAKNKGACKKKGVHASRAPPPVYAPVCGPIGNGFVDLSETGSRTYQKLVCGPIGNRLVPGAKR